MKRLLAVSLCLSLSHFASFAKSPKPTAKKSSAGPAPDKAYLQKIWDGWSTLDPDNVAKFYASGPQHVLRHRSFEVRQLGRIRKRRESRTRRLQERKVHRER